VRPGGVPLRRVAVPRLIDVPDEQSATVEADVETRPLPVLDQEVLAGAAGPVVGPAGVAEELHGVRVGLGLRKRLLELLAGPVGGSDPAHRPLAPRAHVRGGLAVLRAGDVARPASATHQAPVADSARTAVRVVQVRQPDLVSELMSMNPDRPMPRSAAEKLGRNVILPDRPRPAVYRDRRDRRGVGPEIVHVIVGPFVQPVVRAVPAVDDRNHVDLAVAVVVERREVHGGVGQGDGLGNEGGGVTGSVVVIVLVVRDREAADHGADQVEAPEGDLVEVIGHVAGACRGRAEEVLLRLRGGEGARDSRLRPVGIAGVGGELDLDDEDVGGPRRPRRGLAKSGRVLHGAHGLAPGRDHLCGGAEVGRSRRCVVAGTPRRRYELAGHGPLGVLPIPGGLVADHRETVERLPAVHVLVSPQPQLEDVAVRQGERPRRLRRGIRQGMERRAQGQERQDGGDPRGS